MKLYVNGDKTQWRGTQAEAKAAFGSIDQFDVPTDKAGLLEFLNNFAVKAEASEPGVHFKSAMSDDEFAAAGQAIQAKGARTPKPKDTTTGRCSQVELRELSTTLRTLLFKTWSEMEKHDREDL